MAKVVFDENLVTLEDLIAQERGRTITETAKFLAKFVVGDNDEELSAQERYQFIITRTLPEGRAITAAFHRFMGGVKENAVPPQSGTP